MKFLIAGLGNVGSEYDFTRHNIGFSIVEYLAFKHDAKFENDRHVHICEIKIKGRNITLIKPTTYMNLSGKALQYWMQQLKLEKENIMVVTDDLQLPTGKIRIRKNGSAGGHNGLTHIIETLHSEDFPRMRFGIGNNFPKGMQVKYVLGKWDKEEEKILSEKIPFACEALLNWATTGIELTMTNYNK